MEDIFTSAGLRKLVNYNIVHSLEYVDDKMRNKFIEYFDNVKDDINTFIPLQSDYNIKKVNTDLGKQYALVKEWTSEREEVVEMWIVKNDDYIGYAIKYGTKNIHLVFGNNGGNLFVVIPDLGFFNELEDTINHSHYEIDFLNMNIDQIKNLIKNKPYKIIEDVRDSSSILF